MSKCVWAQVSKAQRRVEPELSWVENQEASRAGKFVPSWNLQKQNSKKHKKSNQHDTHLKWFGGVGRGLASLSISLPVNREQPASQIHGSPPVFTALHSGKDTKHKIELPLTSETPPAAAHPFDLSWLNFLIWVGGSRLYMDFVLLKVPSR